MTGQDWGKHRERGRLVYRDNKLERESPPAQKPGELDDSYAGRMVNYQLARGEMPPIVLGKPPVKPEKRGDIKE
jgi:hypothetical protein